MSDCCTAAPSPIPATLTCICHVRAPLCRVFVIVNREVLCQAYLKCCVAPDSSSCALPCSMDTTSGAGSIKHCKQPSMGSSSSMAVSEPREHVFHHKQKDDH